MWRKDTEEFGVINWIVIRKEYYGDLIRKGETEKEMTSDAVKDANER